MDTPHVVGYYLQPSAWIGESYLELAPDLDVQRLSEVVYEGTVQGPLKCKVFKDGLFTFDFSSSANRFTGTFDVSAEREGEARYRALQAAVLNCHLMCLYTSLCHPEYTRVMKRMVVEPSDLVLCSYPDGLGSSKSFVVEELTMARYQATYRPEVPKHMDWRNRSRATTIISPAEVQQAFVVFDMILGRPNAVQIISLADLLIRAVKALSELSFEISLGLNWMVCEACLNQMWSRYLDERGTQNIDGVETKVINKARRDLLNGRDYSASIICEILSLSGKLPFQDYQELGRVRKARNYWIHKFMPVKRDVAYNATRLAQRMLGVVEDVHFTVWPSSPM